MQALKLSITTEAKRGVPRGPWNRLLNTYTVRHKNLMFNKLLYVNDGMGPSQFTSYEAHDQIAEIILFIAFCIAQYRKSHIPE